MWFGVPGCDRGGREQGAGRHPARDEMHIPAVSGSALPELCSNLDHPGNAHLTGYRFQLIITFGIL